MKFFLTSRHWEYEVTYMYEDMYKGEANELHDAMA